MEIPTFYQVVGFKGKTTVVVKELQKQDVSGNGQQGTCIGIKDAFVKNSKEIQARIKDGVLKIDKLIARK